MVIVFVPISWTTGLFLQHPPFGKMYAFQMLPCGSHFIILIPLLDSALLAFFLKMPLDPQSHIGTLSKYSRNWVYFRKSSFLAKCQDPKAYIFVFCHCQRYFISYPHFLFTQIASPICSISVVCMFLYVFSNYLGNKAEYKQIDKSILIWRCPILNEIISSKTIQSRVWWVSTIVYIKSLLSL